MYWQNPAPADGKPAGRRQMYGNAIIDPATGEDIAARDTLGGEFFYRLHFDLHYVPVVWARYSVGLCAMFMLVAIISGVITHKKIFTDFFTFRPGKGLRSWLEFHNVSAVTALPYHAMITDTGVVTLMFMYLPWGIKARYAGDDMRFHDEAANRVADTRKAAGVPAHMLPLEQFVTRTRSDWRGGDVGSVAVSFPNDAHAAVGVTQLAEHLSTDAPSILFDAVNGERLQRTGPPGGANQTRGVMVGLHLAHFAGAWLRASFFGSGLLGCLMVASGVVMWAVKERPKQLKAGRIGFGLRLVDALTIGTVAGLPVAFASFFWANRVLPVSLEARAQMEANLFFAAWAAALLAAFVWPRRAMWSWQLYLGAALFALVTVLNAITTDVHLGVTLPAGQWSLAGVDLVCLFLGICLGIAGFRLQRWKAPQPASARRARAAATTPVQHTAPLQESA